MVKFFLGLALGVGLMIGADYILVVYSWLPEIFILNNSEARSHPRPLFEKQFYAAMEAQRDRLYSHTGEFAPKP